MDYIDRQIVEYSRSSESPSKTVKPEEKENFYLMKLFNDFIILLYL